MTAVTLPETQWGERQGPRVLLLHGITGGRQNWTRVAEALASHGYAVTAVDLRGHGSAPRTASYRFADYAADLPAGLWDVVLGHSLGTVVAVHALQRADFTAKRLLLIEPVFHLDGGILEAVAEAQRGEVKATKEAIRRANPRWADVDVEAKFDEARRLGDDVIELTFGGNAPFDCVDLAKAIELPTLIVAGDEAVDTTFPGGLADELERTMPRCRVIRMAGMGHSPHRDDFDATFAVMREWLQVTKV